MARRRLQLWLLWLFAAYSPLAGSARVHRLKADEGAPAASLGSMSARCRRMYALAGGKRPGYVAVVAQGDEEAAWVGQLPLPAVAYNLAANSTSSVGAPGPPLRTPAAAFTQFMVDHYDCLPPWALFLAGAGRASFSGSTSGDDGDRLLSGASPYFHTLAPATSSALVDVALMDAVRSATTGERQQEEGRSA